MIVSFGELKSYMDNARRLRNLMVYRNGVYIQVYETSESQFNVRPEESVSASIKFEEHAHGVFYVAVSTEKDGSIDYTRSKKFRFEEPLVKLTEAFPHGYHINKIVETLIAL